MKINPLFGNNCWKAEVSGATVEIVGPVTISFSIKKPTCIRVNFKGAREIGKANQVVWDSANPQAHVENQAKAIPAYQNYFKNLLDFN